MAKKSPSIRVHSDGPYVLEQIPELISSQGDHFPTNVKNQLCRCGKSGDKPYCDKTHIGYGFTTGKQEGRQPDKVDRYEGKGITILDNRGVCSHRGYCTTSLPKVFRQGTEPWIDPNGAAAEEIARVIRMCPSGALSYESWNNEIPLAPGGELSLLKNGPLEVTGAVILEDEGGCTPQTGNHYALCRCGGSKNKPFCDGSHWAFAYRAHGPRTPPPRLGRYQPAGGTAQPSPGKRGRSSFPGDGNRP